MTRHSPIRPAAAALTLALFVPATATTAATTKTTKRSPSTKAVTTKRPTPATTPKSGVRPWKPSLPVFCKATKAWTAWETATLNTSGHLNAKWITDSLAYLQPIYDSAPKDIRLPVQFTIIDLMSSRRRIVESVVGELDMPDAVESLIGTGETFASDPNFIANRDKFAAYSVAKCKVDWTAPFKAVGNS